MKTIQLNMVVFLLIKPAKANNTLAGVDATDDFPK